MKYKLIITDLSYRETGYRVSAAYQDDKLMEATCFQKSAQTVLGNIYVGKVKEIVGHLNAAFIEIAPGQACYYSLDDYKDPLFVKKAESKKQLVQGDEIVVQVVKESMKTKPPRVTTNLSFSGKYLVLTTENLRLSLSRKLAPARAEEVRQLLAPWKKADYGLIIRTNADAAKEAELQRELAYLEEQYYSLQKLAIHRTCYSVLFREQPGYIKHIKDSNTAVLAEIITDEKEVYDEIYAYLSHQQPEDLDKLRYYEDAGYPLASLYGLHHQLIEALQKKIWLKSGAYLLIEPTEALTVIDVNSGKSQYKKEQQRYYLKTNLEAAKEIARQLRLRNLSGIIIIDFIDMISTEAKEMLLEVLRQETRKDSVAVAVVGMTKLNLVELTRKKVYRPLIEQLSERS